MGCRLMRRPFFLPTDSLPALTEEQKHRIIHLLAAIPHTSPWIAHAPRTGCVRLPFDATGMNCALCANYMLDPVEPHAFTVAEEATLVDVEDTSADRWMIFYQ